MNRFGTADNNSKACKRKHRLYILKEGEIFPIILDLPTLSVDGFGKYLRRLLTVGKYPNAIVTRFALKKAVSNNGMDYSQVTFTEGRELLPEELTAVRRLAAQVQAHAGLILSYSTGREQKLQALLVAAAAQGVPIRNIDEGDQL